MVRITTEGDYVPWYSRRACPVFCDPCVPAYMGVWKARAGALIPLALILLIVGILLFHCGWAAHLLDDSGQIPIKWVKLFMFEFTEILNPNKNCDYNDNDHV
ncbi:unnamed protein product [Nippostrongylus brasiliensis]|uniref:Transmembrane protein n=1 Tax=Nippostrongylus brasiliensis TaxID=27835 RepID=A0A0N4YF69_NIPBR|nr:unnamed protein product [Nippostrongylus brasiliensis]